MQDDPLFTNPLPDIIALAVKLAQEARTGDFGDAAEGAYEKQMQRTVDVTGFNPAEIDALGAPRTWIGRLIERVQDAWWDRTKPPVTDLHSQLEILFSFPVPLLQTHPLQDTPFEYDEVDQQLAAAQAEIIAAITDQTDWTPIAFEPSTCQDDKSDPMDQVLAVWALRKIQS